MKHILTRGLAAMAMLWVASTAFAAEDLKKVTVAIGQGGKWDSSLPQLGLDKGIYKKHGLELDILYTQGGGETQQIVISGSADIGIAVGTQGAMGAYSKGAPIRIIGSVANGDDAFYYVRSDSKIHKMSDLNGETLAYSRNGSSTHSFALGFVELMGVKAKLIATGGPSSTLTSVMSGQVDVGWSAPPFVLKQIQSGEVRKIAITRDLPSVKGHTVRLMVTNLDALENKPELIEKFLEAYRETIKWAYSSDEALEAYSVLAKIDIDTARMVRDEFDTLDYINPDVMLGVGDLMEQAVKFKYLSKPLTDEQLNELIMIKGWKK
ncbi:MAG: ABC transporter substrate-binding protein [Rhizobiaceae bacterium]|nr:ABC transporter substrate-binding protein [Rhizobiaceae bacterium]MBL4696394.1 ABC transporter substrate-binding protein [Rhizobiaceae bacterium]